MAIDIEYYRKIQNMYGTDDVKSAQRYEVQSKINRDFGNTLDSYSITINGVEQELTIIKTTNTHIKKIKSRPNEVFYVGQYVEWKNRYWLITEVDVNDDIVSHGKMEECNYLLKWQNEIGEIIERWAIISSASKYNDGTDGGKVIVLGSDQLFVVIPVDAESIKLKKSMGKKFFIDHNTENPTTYELTGTGNVESTYNGHGVTSWIAKECVYKATEDDLEYGIPNYFSSASTPTEDVDTYHMVIDCISRDIKIGRSKTMTATLYNGENEEIADTVYDWYVTSKFMNYITYKSNGNTITLSVSNECEEIGEQINIRCASRYTGQVDEITLTIKEAY